MTSQEPDRGADRQPIFNIPRVMVVLLALLAAIHIIRETLLSTVQQAWVILNFAYFPSRPEAFLAVREVPGAEVWSFVTYSLLHADWVHLGINALWMVVFGSPLAWRFGAWRFLAFSAVAAVAGALAHLVTHGGEQIPVVGASAMVSAHMTGALRFMFIAPRGRVRSYHEPAAPLAAVFSDPRTLMLLGFWIVINVGVGVVGWFGDGGVAIAWQAHIGGLIAGLVLFPLFDPVPRQRPTAGADSA